MECTQFYEYVISLLKEAGHMTTNDPIYVNHTSKQTLYIDSNEDVCINRFDRQLLTEIDNISLIMEIRWPEIFEELTENIRIYSITVSFSESNRSINIADIHKLLQKYWNCTHSIVFFKNGNQYVISFANRNCSHILSDWYEIYSNQELLISKIEIGNMKLETSTEYFYDFIYAVARKYYIYPISFEEASYGMIPLNYLRSAKIVDIKDIIRTNMSLYRTLYGNDYVEAKFEGQEENKVNSELNDEIDKINFELELATDEQYTYDEIEKQKEDFDELDDLDDIEKYIDSASFNDPNLMVKWIEQNDEELIQQKLRNNHINKETYKEHEHLKAEEAERLEREHLEAERLEHERLEAERLERERLETERLEHERLEAERLERERLETERLERERLETERLEHERLEAERLERERLETERLEHERLEAERLERERLETERLELIIRELEWQQKRYKVSVKFKEKYRKIQAAHKGSVGSIQSRIEVTEKSISRINEKLSKLGFLRFIKKQILNTELKDLQVRFEKLTQELDSENKTYKDTLNRLKVDFEETMKQMEKNP